MSNKILLLIALFYITSNSIKAQSCTGYATYTHGAWGACASGNNIGNYLDANFSAAFPNGLEIGCINKLRLTSANAVRNYLPQSTAPAALPNGTLINPSANSYRNILAGQLVALALNIGFDNYDSGFAVANDNLKDLIIASGPFIGWTVQNLFLEANKKIGGCSSSSFTLSQFNTALDNINNNYDNGTSNNNFLSCQLHLTACKTNLTCNGGSDGSINLTVHNGQAPFTYQWSNGANTQDLNNLPAGIYTVTVTDNNGQTANLSISLQQPTPIIVNSILTSITCNGDSNGSISLSVIGGDAPYSYQWSNGASTSSISNLNPGIYQVTITDYNGCSITESNSVTEPNAIVVTGNKTDAFVCDQFVCDGTADITITGGTLPYQTLWSDGSSNTTSLINLCPTVQLYVTVTDANGCLSTYDFNGIECKQCDTLTTYSQNTWGEDPNGTNLSSYLHANFTAAFPGGITIGCNNILTFTNAQSITDWLPKTGTPTLLPTGILTDDTNYNNSFAAQLVTAKLNVGFDSYDPNFNPSSDYLGNRFFTSGLYAGYTVDQVIEESSNVIGGCVPNYSLAELNYALNAANLNYENGNHANGYLACRFIAPIRYADENIRSIQLNGLYPNPCSEIVNASIKLSEDADLKIEVIDMLGQVVMSKSEFMYAGTNSLPIETKNLESQVYIIRLFNGYTTCSSMLMVK